VNSGTVEIVSTCIGSCVVIGTAIISYVSRRLSAQDKAMAANTTALAVIVAEFQPLRTTVDNMQTRVNTLSEATAVLAATLERHEDWHSRHDRNPNMT
jgi:hypothetical protein